ncbi:hypothetical protein [Muricoccus pecuniae]|uniref:Uncharacterized protein n=1 Tax=Muricoccus pecuniae TaxID=693023 RepID=A0A840Y6W0_9PROT|nr:hypothetical protein [Roseomonas pecuniae]MBB5696475.1 hypothetical protein [Roseomonas pecuniae]
MANIAADERETHRGQFQSALYAMANRHKLTLMVTLAYNRETPPEVVERDLSHFLGRMDRELLGSGWAKKPSERRTRHFSVLEHPRTNAHIHMLVSPADGQWIKFGGLAEALWKGVVASGSVRVEPISSLTGALGYVTKFISPERADRLILAPFHV